MKIKYPRTYHLEWSEGKTSDDKTLYDLSSFIGKEIVITLKLDGENTTMMKDSFYARSLDSNNHPSRNLVKGIWGNIKHEIPDNWRICGENLYAKHSIEYNDLSSYFMVFSIWNEKNECLSVDDTLEYCKLLGLEHVPILYRAKFNEYFLQNFGIIDTEKDEGYVIRLCGSFKFDDFSKSVAKWVRKNHVTTDEHWTTQKIVPNKLKNEKT